MGLPKIQKIGPDQSLWQPGIWLFPATLLAAAGILAAFGDEGRAALSYDRAAIAAGQWWRLLSGHFVHLGATHFLLNGAGVLLVWLLVGRVYPLRHWVLILIVAIVGIDLGFWFLYPSLSQYVGLSGVLHGLLIAGLIAELPDRRWDTWLLLLGTGCKLGYEQLVGPIPGSEATSGGNVIVDAHLYGAISGAAIGIISLIRVRRTRTI